MPLREFFTGIDPLWDAAALGLKVQINCHTFRATGITAYMDAGGTLENAQRMATHESPRTTKLYDRTGDEITLDEVERIRIERTALRPWMFHACERRSCRGHRYDCGHGSCCILSEVRDGRADKHIEHRRMDVFYPSSRVVKPRFKGLG